MVTDQCLNQVGNGSIYDGFITETGGSVAIFDSAFKWFKSPKTANNPDRSRRGTGVKWRGAGLFSIAMFAAVLNPGPAYADENDAVTVWNERAIATIVNGTAASTQGVQFPPPSAFIHLAIVQGAVYDAVNAIKGGHDPYLRGLKAATSASKGAAASTAGSSFAMSISVIRALPNWHCAI